MTTPPPALLDDLFEPDPSTLTRQYEEHLLSVLLWMDDDGSLTRSCACLAPSDFATRELGELYRWHLRYVTAFGCPDGAGLCHRIAQHAAAIRPHQPTEAARLDALSVTGAHLAGGHVTTFPARVAHYARQIVLGSVLRQLEEIQRQRASALRTTERTPDALLQVLAEGREAEDALLARVTG